MINVVDIMRLQPDSEHPHGLSDHEFDSLFTTDKPVIFAYHGYPWLIHRLTYRRTNHAQMHVRGFKERGTTTTPFDMVMLNDLDRFHLVIDVIDRVEGLANRAAALRQRMVDARLAARRYTREHGEDDPDISGWTWDSDYRSNSKSSGHAQREPRKSPVNWPAMSEQAVAPHPHPVVGQLAALHHFRTYVDIGVVVVVLALTNLIAHFTTPWASIATVPAAAVGLVILVRSRGLGWAELGLSREHWKAGAGYAVAAVAVVLSVIAIGMLLPWTRPMFMNNNYATVSGALIASMIIIPLQTVIPEELAFRGVLHGALNRAWGFRGVAAAGSLLFGLWHIATSLGLTSSNVGFTRLFGGGLLGTVAGVVLAVAATAVAGFVFTWLRRRSGSLIAPIALHWSLNGLGALAAALVWHLST